jgi:hypothetical protein
MVPDHPPVNLLRECLVKVACAHASSTTSTAATMARASTTVRIVFITSSVVCTSVAPTAAAADRASLVLLTAAKELITLQARMAAQETPGSLHVAI